MNVRVLLLSLIACLLGSAWTGCGSIAAETGRNKNPTIVMELDPTVQKAVAAVRIGDEVRFLLPCDRGPEYIWQIVTNDPRSMRQSSSLVYKAGTTPNTGTSSVAFIAQRPSRSLLRFAYVLAAGGKETEIVDAHEILVTVRN